MFDSITIKDVKIKIGELCKQKRKACNLSQSALAEELGLSRITVQNIENGKNATLDTFLKIANHFSLLEDFYKVLQQTEQDIKETKDIDSFY